MFPSSQEILNKIGVNTSSSSSGSTPPSSTEIFKKIGATDTPPKANPFPFFTNAVDAISNIGSKISSAVGGFAKTQIENVRSAITGTTKITPQDVLSGISDTGTGIFKGTQSLAEGINEGVLRIFKSASEAALGKQTTEKIGSNPFISDLSGAVTGKDTVPSYQDIYAKSSGWATKNNASSLTAKSFGGLVVLGSLFADNPLIGGAEGAGIKLSSNAIKDLAAASTDDAVESILKNEIPNITPTQLKAVSPIFRTATDPAEIKSAVDHLNKVIKAPISEALNPLPTSDEIAKKAGIEIKTKADVPPAVDEALNMRNARLAENSTIPPELSTSAEEAKKYKSAEEFVKAQGEPLYHRTNETFDNFNLDKKGEISSGVHFDSSKARSDGKANIERFGKNQIEAYTDAKIADITARVVDGKPSYKHLPSDLKEAMNFSSNDMRTARLKELGYGGYRSGTEVVIFDPKNIKTKSQLTDFYNKVKGADQTIPEVTKRPDVNLIRDLAKEKQQLPISQKLSELYPNIADRTVFTLSKRLSRITREDDIRRILNIADAINKQGPDSYLPPLSDLTKETIQNSRLGIPDSSSPAFLAGELPSPISRLMTKAQLETHIKTVKKNILNNPDAIFAKQEYDNLWEQIDVKLIDRYEQLGFEREIVRDAIDQNPARKLLKFYGKAAPTDYTLSEVLNRAVNRGGAGRKLDDIVNEMGYASMEDADKGLADYLRAKESLDAINSEIKEIKPRVQAAKIIRAIGDEVPVAAKKSTDAIEKFATKDLVENTYKDITGFVGGFRDLWRNFDAFFGKEYQNIKKTVLDPFDDAKGAMVDELKQLGKQLDENVVSKFGIERGSKLDEAVFEYAQGELSEEDLLAKVGRENTDKVKLAATWFHKTYDDLLDRINEVRAKIYPNNASKLVAKRKDYMRHFQEMGSDFEGLRDILFDTGPIGKGGISPELAGISEHTKPLTKYLSIAQQRIGKNSEKSAIGGFVDYANQFAYATHIDPQIGNFRYLRRKLAEIAEAPGTMKTTVNGERTAGINNFLEYLDDYANRLAAKTAPADRWLQKRVPGGRTTMKAIDWVNSRIKSNTLLGNFSSAIAQAFNVPQGIASAKQHSFEGIKRTLGGLIEKNEPMTHSTFIKERYMGNLADDFKTEWVSHPVKRGVEQAKDFAVWVMQALDQAGTKFIWNSHYSKALAENIPDPVRYADDATRRLVAGRGVGEVPIDQASKTFQFFAPFQVEVGNLWWVMKDFVSKKDFAGLAILFVANYLMNEAAQSVRGSRVTFDPINSLIQGGTELGEELKQDNVARGIEKFLGRQFGEILSNIPGGQTLVAAIPDDKLQLLTGMKKAELFGQGDPGRFGSGTLFMTGLSDPLYRLLPPFGGVQAKKSIDGIKSMLSGEVESSTGKLNFKTDSSPLDVVQSLLFGKNSLPEAQKFFEERDDLFQRLYRQDASRNELHMEAETTWSEAQKTLKNDGPAKAAEMMMSVEKKNPALAKEVMQIAKDEKMGLSGTDRLIKMLGVENGERAKYLVLQVSKLKTLEEKAKYMQSLEEKKLISADVRNQIIFLLKEQQKPKQP